VGTDALTLDLADIRGADSNTLLRLYDLARGRFDHAPSQQERVRVGRALQRIVQELRRRDVPL
jgi:hypothetical protein